MYTTQQIVKIVKLNKRFGSSIFGIVRHETEKALLLSQINHVDGTVYTEHWIPKKSVELGSVIVGIFEHKKLIHVVKTMNDYETWFSDIHDARFEFRNNGGKSEKWDVVKYMLQHFGNLDSRI